MSLAHVNVRLSSSKYDRSLLAFVLRSSYFCVASVFLTKRFRDIKTKISLRMALSAVDFHREFYHFLFFKFSFISFVDACCFYFFFPPPSPLGDQTFFLTFSIFAFCCVLFLFSCLVLHL